MLLVHLVSPHPARLPLPLLEEEEEEAQEALLPSRLVTPALPSPPPVAPPLPPSSLPTPASTLAAPTSKLVRPSTLVVEEEEELLPLLLLPPPLPRTVALASPQALSLSRVLVDQIVTAIQAAVVSARESVLAQL
jgi:hypothetical protein